MTKPETEQMTETGPTVRWTSAADVFKLPPDVFEFFWSQPSGVGLIPGEQLGRGDGRYSLGHGGLPRTR